MRQLDEQRKAEELAAFLAVQKTTPTLTDEVEKDQVPFDEGGMASDEVGVAPGVTSEVAADVAGTGMEPAQEAGSSLTYGGMEQGQSTVVNESIAHSEETRSLTATNPALAQVLPPILLGEATPTAPPPTYDQVSAGQPGAVFSPSATQTFQPLFPPPLQYPGYTAQAPPPYAASSYNYPYAPYQATPTEISHAPQSHTWLPTNYIQSPVSTETSSNEGSPTVPVIDRSTKPVHSLSASIGG